MENLLDVKRILVAVEEGELSQLAFKIAIDRAKKFDATLIITSILDDDNFNVYEYLGEDYEKKHQHLREVKLAEYKETALKAGVKNVETMFGEGTPGDVIIKEVIPETNPDLLIIASARKKGFKKFLGSQAEYMVKYSPISVFVIR